MATITTSKVINLSLLKAELGVDVFTSEGEVPDSNGPIEVIAEVDEATLKAAIDAHTPPLTPTEKLYDTIKAASTLDELKAALLGTSGPGVQPKLPLS